MTKQILFEDNFDGDTLDDVWFPRGTGYVEEMEYAKGDLRAVEVKGGRCHLKTIPDPDVPPGRYGPYLNGHIGAHVTLEPPCWVAARIKFHAYHGSHGALWLQSWSGYAPGDAEIDVAETFGTHSPDRKDGTNMYHNIYWREPGQPEGEYRSARKATNDRAFLKQPGSWYQKELVYKVRWTKDGYEFYISNKPVAYITEGLSISPKYPILSVITRDYEVANQGTHAQGGEIVKHPQPTVMSVDWIRAWRNK